MHFSTGTGFFLLALALSATGLATPDKRQEISPMTSEDNEIITAPANGTSVAANKPFTFGVQNAPHDHNICHGVYTPVNVYILQDKPTTDDLNSTFGFSNYLYYFGNWTLVNIDAPPFGSPPPPTLTMPDLGEPQSGKMVYLAVIEMVNGCLPLDYTDYSIDSRALAYTE